MNIKFKKPKLDTCGACDKFKSLHDVSQEIESNSNIKQIKQDWEEHQTRAEIAYQSKKNDKMFAAENSNDVKVCTFDLQQCLPTPYLRSGFSFYKRQLWTFNLTIHDCTTKIANCFMWHEAISSRGGNQVASCLLKYIQNLFENHDYKHIIFYSDSCGGQNKNSFMCAMFMLIMEIYNKLEIIDHKFLEPGHTHMECDSSHATIERKKKNTDMKIHHPDDWYNLVRCCGNRNQFKVNEMESNDFYSFSSLVKDNFVFKQNNEAKQKFCFKNV